MGMRVVGTFFQKENELYGHHPQPPANCNMHTDTHAYLPLGFTLDFRGCVFSPKARF